MGFHVVLAVKNPPAHTGGLRDLGSVPGSGKFPGGGNGKLLQDFCLGNPVDRGAGWLQSVGSERARND